MKKSWLLLLTAWVLLGCSDKLYVSSDYDKEVDFTKYKTFSWSKEQEEPGKRHPMFDNEMNRKRIMNAIETEMKKLGFKRLDWAPDLLVDFHVSIDDKMDYMVLSDHPYGYSFWPDYNVTSYSVKKGALIIHLVDTKTKQLVWQGLGSKRLGDVPANDAERKIQKGVEAIMAQYPISHN